MFHVNTRQGNVKVTLKINLYQKTKYISHFKSCQYYIMLVVNILFWTLFNVTIKMFNYLFHYWTTTGIFFNTRDY